MTGYAMRPGTPPDVPFLVDCRVNMLVDMGQGEPADFAGGRGPFAGWLFEGLGSRTVFAWVVEHNGAPVACACLWLKPRQPGGRNGVSIVPYVLNVFVARAHRRAGLARLMVEAAVEWSRELGCDGVELHASAEGRPLYEDMGFVATREMRLTFPAYEADKADSG